MSKKSKIDSPFPEMSDLLKGMEDLMRDENGNALTPDHQQYQKLSSLLEHMSKSLEAEEADNQFKGPQGQA